MDIIPQKRLMRAKDACNYISIGRSTFLKRVSEGLLPQGIKFGRCTLWDVEDLNKIIQEWKREELSS